MKKKKGFTLVELIVTIALLALIGSVIAINMVGLNKKQEDKEQTRIESLIKAAAESYVTVEHIQTDCLNVQKLLEKSYLKENAVKDYESYFVKVNKKDGIYEVVEKVADESKCEGTIKEKYTLTYDANGGNNAPSKETHDALSKFSLSNQIPNRAGYKFSGWENKKDKSVYQPNDRIALTSNTTLYARWSTGFYNVTYNKDTIDNVTNMPDNIESIGYNTLIHISSSIPNRAGYNFLGWSTIQGGNVQYNANSEHTVVSDLFLYAKWTEGIYSISLNQQSGSGGTSTIYEKYSVGLYSNNTVTQAITKVSVPTRTGYVFKGYYEKQNGSGKQLIDASGNITNNLTNKFATSNTTIYAYWEEMPVVKINVENGTVTNSTATRKGSSTTPYEYYVLKGSNSNYSFKANDGYIFDSLQCSNSSKIVRQTSNTDTTAYLELGNVDSSMECTVKFKSIKLTLILPGHFQYDMNDIKAIAGDNATFEVEDDLYLKLTLPIQSINAKEIKIYGSHYKNRSQFGSETYSLFDPSLTKKSEEEYQIDSNNNVKLIIDKDSDYDILKFNIQGLKNTATLDLSQAYYLYGMTALHCSAILNNNGVDNFNDVLATRVIKGYRHCIVSNCHDAENTEYIWKVIADNHQKFEEFKLNFYTPIWYFGVSTELFDYIRGMNKTNLEARLNNLEAYKIEKFVDNVDKLVPVFVNTKYLNMNDNYSYFKDLGEIQLCPDTDDDRFGCGNIGNIKIQIIVSKFNFSKGFTNIVANSSIGQASTQDGGHYKLSGNVYSGDKISFYLEGAGSVINTKGYNCDKVKCQKNYQRGVYVCDINVGSDDILCQLAPGTEAGENVDWDGDFCDDEEWNPNGC